MANMTKIYPRKKTMQEVKDISNPHFVGMAAIAAVSAATSAATGIASTIGGLVGKKKAARKAREERERAKDAATESRLTTYQSGEGKLTGAGGGFVNPFASNSAAMGGPMPMASTSPASSEGAVSGGMQEFNSGGSHEEHPLGGIPIGMGENGKPNTVEEGEVAINLNIQGKPTKFIFPKRVPYVASGNLPKFVRGESYADAAKSIEKAFEGRYDKYSRSTRAILLESLAKEYSVVGEQLIAQKPESPSNEFAWGGPEDELSDREKLMAWAQAGQDELSIGKQGKGMSILQQGIAGSTSGQGGRIEPELTVTPRVPPTGGDGLFSEKAMDTVSGIAAGVGAATQVAGLIGGIVGKRRLEKEGYDTVAPVTVGKGNLNPFLVNRQNILRGIAGATSSANRVSAESSGGNAGAFAGQALGTHLNSTRALAEAMLGADVADATEKARVQQLGVGIDQFNAQQVTEAATATAQNKGAFNAQLAAYSAGNTANISNIGQSLMNYDIARKSAKHTGYAAELEAIMADLKSKGGR